MKRKRLLSFVMILYLLMAGGSVVAHHGNASYDDSHPIALKGTVTQFQWSNPHVILSFDVKDNKDNLVHWTAETLSPGRLTRAGWSKNSVKAGDQVTVVLMPAKNGTPIGHFHELVFADGKKLDVGEECQYCPGNPNFHAEPAQR